MYAGRRRVQQRNPEGVGTCDQYEFKVACEMVNEKSSYTVKSDFELCSNGTINFGRATLD